MNNVAPLQTPVRLLSFIVLVFGILYFGKPFFVPITFAAILAMLFFPMSHWLEQKGISRGFASFLCILTFVVMVGAVIGLLLWQLAGMADQMSGMEQKLTELKAQLQQWLESKFGVEKAQQEKFIQDQKQSGGSSVSKIISTALSGLSGFLVDTILVLVYIFLLLFFRTQLKQFLLAIVSEGNKETAKKIITEGSKVSRKYVTGLAKMIGILWLMYGIGFTIVGVKNAIFFAILCGLFEIVPFVGNLAGTGLTIIGSVTQGGSNLLVGILVTYAIVQFVQTYLLEPLVVGSEENVNPLFTIIVLVIGEMVWGIPGMVLALPLLGILKVIFDNIEELRPYGYLVGKKKEKNKESLFTKIKKKFV
jgi:predicted PurR-regulated permease PerM